MDDDDTTTTDTETDQDYSDILESIDDILSEWGDGAQPPLVR